MMDMSGRYRLEKSTEKQNSEEGVLGKVEDDIVGPIQQ